MCVCICATRVTPPQMCKCSCDMLGITCHWVRVRVSAKVGSNYFDASSFQSAQFLVINQEKFVLQKLPVATDHSDSHRGMWVTQPSVSSLTLHLHCWLTCFYLMQCWLMSLTQLLQCCFYLFIISSPYCSSNWMDAPILQEHPLNSYDRLGWAPDLPLGDLNHTFQFYPCFKEGGGPK